MSKVVNLIEKYLVKNGNRLDERKIEIKGSNDNTSYLLHYQNTSSLSPGGRKKDIVSFYTDNDIISYEIEIETDHDTFLDCITKLQPTNNHVKKGTKINFDKVEISLRGESNNSKKIRTFIKAYHKGKIVFYAYNDESDYGQDAEKVKYMKGVLPNWFPKAEIGTKPLGKL